MPAGLVDSDETPENAAIRELEEETGFKATKADVLETSFMQVPDAGGIAHVLFSSHLSVI